MKIVSDIQCNPDIRELPEPGKSHISGFLLYQSLVYFIYINTGSNLGPDKISLISELLLYPGILYTEPSCSYIRVSYTLNQEMYL